MAEAAISQELIDQWSDPRWRLNHLYTIIDKEGREIPFQLNDAQESLLSNLNYSNVILKARQLGFTTFICLYMLDACVFNSNVRAGVIAHNLDDAKAFFDDKIKFAYDQLDPAIKNANPAVQDSAGSLKFKNNSRLRVGTSLRSGTYQYLLVSEYGKICARDPKKAKEIKTGALNTVQAGQFIFIESTAEGRTGEFHDICKRAERLQQQGIQPGPLDFRFHFYPWYLDPNYTLDPTNVVITPEMAAYFDELESKGIMLTEGQKAWYVKKEETQQDDMKQEYPSTPDEAFEGTTEGAYFRRQMARVRKEKRICKVPFEPLLPVNTFWDLGLNDKMVIWLHQQHQKEHRFIGYYENTGEGFAHYRKWLQDWAQEREAVWGKHFAPHDIEVRNLGDVAKTRKQIAAEMGLKFETVPRPSSKNDAIELARGALGLSWFDEETCLQGVTHLDNYRKAWSDTLGEFRNEPLHDEASHGADGYQTFAIAEDRGMIAGRKSERRKAKRGTIA